MFLKEGKSTQRRFLGSLSSVRLVTCESSFRGGLAFVQAVTLISGVGGEGGARATTVIDGRGRAEAGDLLGLPGGVFGPGLAEMKGAMMNSSIRQQSPEPRQGRRGRSSAAGLPVSVLESEPARIMTLFSFFKPRFMLQGTGMAAISVASKAGGRSTAVKPHFPLPRASLAELYGGRMNQRDCPCSFVGPLNHGKIGRRLAYMLGIFSLSFF